MKRILPFLFSLFFFLNTSAQEQDIIKCAAHEIMLQEIAANTDLAEKKAKYDQELKDYLNNSLDRSVDSTLRIIPVVVHVLHQGGPENISKDQIEDQIRILNEDFRRLNADAVNTPSGFDSVAADCKVEFVLAKIDPLGNCTEGINRIYTTKTYNASNETGFKAISFWNSYQYMNMWVVNNITMDNNYGTVIGYAQFPESGLMSTDGIVVAHNQVGSIGTASTNNYYGRTTTHEVGHWLGLRHTWGDSECGSDGVEDTPLAEDANFGCFSYPKLSNCDGADPVNGEMFMNYMDYSDGACQNLFTIGQKEIIDFTLNGSRSNLWSEENLIATGILNSANLDCTPIAQFTSDNTWVCAGENVFFYDNSYNGTVDNRTWTFQGGSPGTSTSSTANVTYQNAGVYNVTLEVSNANGSSTVTEVGKVVVSNAWASDSDGSYNESFESNSNFWNKWKRINYDNGNGWSIYEGNVVAGNQCVRMNNFENTIFEEDWLVSPSYNFSHFSGTVSINFDYAAAARTTEPADLVKIYISTDCGETWIPRGSGVSGTILANNGFYLNEFMPNEITIWDNYSITIPANYLDGNFRYALVFTSGGSGNHVYIDDVRITASNVALEEENISFLEVYPNPSLNHLFVQFNAKNIESCSISLMDVLGKKVDNLSNKSTSIGINSYSFDMKNYLPGIYFLQVKMSNITKVKKIIIN